MGFPPGAEPVPSGSNGSRGRGSRMFGGRGLLISSASTIVFFALIALLVALAPGSSLVAERFFDPYHLNRSLFGTVTTPSVVGAFVLNIKMFLIAEVLILILALVIAIVRGIPGPVFFPFRAVAVGYTDLFRGVPLILVLYMIGFGLPALGLKFFSSQSEVTYGVVALSASWWGVRIAVPDGWTATTPADRWGYLITDQGTIYFGINFGLTTGAGEAPAEAAVAKEKEEEEEEAPFILPETGRQAPARLLWLLAAGVALAGAGLFLRCAPHHRQTP